MLFGVLLVVCGLLSPLALAAWRIIDWWLDRRSPMVEYRDMNYSNQKFAEFNERMAMQYDEAKWRNDYDVDKK